ncbi:MAG: hypothetical protein AB1346_06535 [Thermodesulfobacteriota bacterium]
MRSVRHATGRFIGAAMFAAFAFSLSLGAAAIAADTASMKVTTKHEFKDPYDGGTRLPKGGGEPGKAYKELLDAAGKKDHKRICRLMTTDENEMKECMKDKKAAEGIAFYLGDPKGQKILDGYSKGDEATLDVAYPHAGAPDSYASVRMKKEGGKWIWNGFSASGSAEVSASAGGTADFGPPSKTKEDLASLQKCPMLGKWEFVGKDDKGAKWTGVVDIKIENEEVACDINIQGPKFSQGIGGPFPCKPDQKSFTCETGGNSFTATLSADGKNLTNGKWNTKGDDFLNFPKVTGSWTAKLQGR